jgi:hypothetical protein
MDLRYVGRGLDKQTDDVGRGLDKQTDDVVRLLPSNSKHEVSIKGDIR